MFVITPDYLLSAAIVAVGACLQGASGIGFAMFASPILAILHPELVPGPMLMLGGLAALLSAMREFRQIDLSGLGYALAGRIPASFMAGAIIALLPSSGWSVLFAVLVLTAVGLSLLGWRVLPTPRNLFTAGVVSGLMGTITSIGAPPMAIVYQSAAAPQLRATIGAYFVFAAGFSLVALALVDRFGARDMLSAAGLIVPMVAGFLVSNRLIPLLDRGRLRIFVLASSGAAALVLLLTHVF